MKTTTSRPYDARDREQVEQDRLQRQHERPERAHEQHVGREEHGEHQPRERGVREREEVDAARRPTAGEHPLALGEGRRGNQVVAQAMHEPLRRGHAVLVLADHAEVDVLPRRVDVLRAHSVVDGADLRISLQLLDEPPLRCLRLGSRRATRASRVDDDVRRRNRARADGRGEHVVPLHSLEVLRDALVRPRPEIQREHRRRRRDQQHDRDARDEHRAPHDHAREP